MPEVDISHTRRSGEPVDVSRKMLRHYAHIGTEAKQKAVEAISRRTVEVPESEKAAS